MTANEADAELMAMFKKRSGSAYIFSDYAQPLFVRGGMLSLQARLEERALSVSEYEALQRGVLKGRVAP